MDQENPSELEGKSFSTPVCHYQMSILSLINFYLGKSLALRMMKVTNWHPTPTLRYSTSTWATVSTQMKNWTKIPKTLQPWNLPIPHLTMSKAPHQVIPTNFSLLVPHNQTSQPAIQLVLKRPALINLSKPTANSPTGSLSSGSHQQRSRIHGQAVCQPTHPHSHPQSSHMPTSSSLLGTGKKVKCSMETLYDAQIACGYWLSDFLHQYVLLSKLRYQYTFLMSVYLERHWNRGSWLRNLLHRLKWNVQ